MSHYFNLLKKLTITSNLGEEKTLDDLKYDYLGIYFTAPWCSACTVFKPQLDRIHQLSRGISLRFEVATFSLDNTDEYVDYLAKTNNHWTFKPVDDGVFQSVMKYFRVQHIPKFVVFDREGRIISENGVQDIYKHKNGIFQYWNQFLK